MLRFESSRPSQPLRSPHGNFRLAEKPRYLAVLGRCCRVSGLRFLNFPGGPGGFLPRVSGGDFSISVRDVRETGSCMPETGSNATRLTQRGSSLAWRYSEYVLPGSESLLRKSKPLLLLGPGIRKRFGKAGNGQLCWRRAIDYGGDDLG